MAKMAFKVSGMHCASCEKILKMEIGELAGVKNVKADAVKGIVEVEGNRLDATAIRKAITQNGYKV
ncbi:MAG: heavy-metal-associated domain-containing protein [Candidatus Micrarchaeia archaeon]